jgi:hypothetical protein
MDELFDYLFDHGGGGKWTDAPPRFEAGGMGYFIFWWARVC